MTAPLGSFNLTAPVVGANGPIAVGDCVVALGGVYVLATAANRAAAGERAHGIAVTPWSSTTVGAVSIQNVGVIDATTAGLAAGAASSLRVSVAGRLERATVSGSDDVVGRCEADGTAFLQFGILTAAIVNGGGGVTLPIVLTTDVSGTLPVANGGTGLTALATGIATWLGTPSGANLAAALTSALPATKGGTGLTALATGIATWLGTPSGANLAAALTSALPVSKGGTNRTALGSSLQVLRTNTGATDTEWATISAGGVIGSDTQVPFNNAGTMAGDAGMTYTVGTQRLEIMNFRCDGILDGVANGYRDGATLQTGDLLQVEQALNADFSNATTTLASSNLTFTMEAGSSWKVILDLTVQGNSGGTGIQLALLVPSGASLSGFFFASSGTLPTATPSIAQVSAVSPTAIATLSAAANQVTVIRVEVVVNNPTTAGSFTVQTKSGAAQAVLLKANSALSARRTSKV